MKEFLLEKGFEQYERGCGYEKYELGNICVLILYTYGKPNVECVYIYRVTINDTDWNRRVFDNKIEAIVHITKLLEERKSR